MKNKRQNGEGTWGEKNIKGQIYKYFRNSEGKYFYGRTIKEIKKNRNLYESTIQQSDSAFPF